MIPEAQLLGAASTIEAAARRLAELQPRRLPKRAIDVQKGKNTVKP